MWLMAICYCKYLRRTKLNDRLYCYTLTSLLTSNFVLPFAHVVYP